MARWRGSTAERGYGVPHQKLRNAWKPRVDAGQVDCHAIVCLEELDGHGRRIPPGAPWHLGHTTDRSAWTGPEHQRCGAADGARRGNQANGFVPLAAGADVRCQLCGQTYHRAARTCEMCGGHYHPSYGEQRTCGRQCGRALQRRNRLAGGWVPRDQRPVQPLVAGTGSCKHCGRQFNVKSIGRPRLYCSGSCRALASQQRLDTGLVTSRRW
jgi:hypothetical protein